jgi:hypothetical protein
MRPALLPTTKELAAMKNPKNPTAIDLLAELNAHIVYTPTQAVVKSLTSGCDLTRISRFDDLYATLVDLVRTKQLKELR